MEKSWEAREPPLIQRSHLDDLLAKYRRERRPALEDEETEESGQSGGDDDGVELLSDSAVGKLKRVVILQWNTAGYQDVEIVNF